MNSHLWCCVWSRLLICDHVKDETLAAGDLQRLVVRHKMLEQCLANVGRRWPSIAPTSCSHWMNLCKHDTIFTPESLQVCQCHPKSCVLNALKAIYIITRVLFIMFIYVGVDILIWGYSSRSQNVLIYHILVFIWNIIVMTYWGQNYVICNDLILGL